MTEPHSYLCPMRWSDMDAQGHVNNTAFLVYLEQARIDLFFEQASRAGVRSIAEGVVVARHEIDYRRPIVYRHEPLRIELWCSHVGAASFTVDYEVYDGTPDVTTLPADASQPAVTASTKCVAYDLAAGAPRRLTPAERDFVTAYRLGRRDG